MPVYEAQKAVFAVQGKPPPDPADLNVQYVVSICTVAVPAVLFLLLFVWFLGYFSPSLVNRTLLTLALGLATIVFPFARVIISHVTAAGLLFASFVLVYIVSRRDTVPARGAGWFVEHPCWAAFLAGLSAGLAVLFEYPTIAIAALIGLYAIVRLPPSLLWRAALGGALGVASVLFYNAAAFGSPLTTGYTGHSISYGGYYQNGFGGLTWPPQADALWGMSFSPYRGLFFLSPFLLLAFPGYVLWARRGGIEWLLSLAIPTTYFIVIAMYPIWFAGTSVGPRLLTPALPFLALPIIFVLDYLSSWRPAHDVRGPVYGLISGLLALSLINVWAETIGGTTGYPYAWVTNPLFEHSLPALARGEIAPSWGTSVFGLTGVSSLLPLLLVFAAWSLIVFTPMTGTVARLQRLAGHS